jgi:hypothetical protein
MTDIVEKQDVDISRIFNWGRVFQVIDPKDDSVVVDVYMKLLGDADLGKARVYALRKSSELRRKLREENSDERVAYIRTIDELEDENLINFIVIFSGRELANEARRNVKIPDPKPPKSDAPLEKMEKFQKDIDEYPEKRQKAIADAIEKEVAKLKKSLEGKSKEELYKQYVKLLVDEFCEREALEAFENMQVYHGCYTDDSYKTKFFSSFDEFDNLEPNTKQLFKDAYKQVDIDINELKKLRRATQ